MNILSEHAATVAHAEVEVLCTPPSETSGSLSTSESEARVRRRAFAKRMCAKCGDVVALSASTLPPDAPAMLRLPSRPLLLRTTAHWPARRHTEETCTRSSAPTPGSLSATAAARQSPETPSGREMQVHIFTLHK